jgi:glycosyltransferase involved in cell wall biosynthesis
MKSDPLVTVLMPVYNGGKYLRPTMETILEQTYRDFEFLIINDCSTDGSLETIRSFSDPRIRIHTNDKNVGQTPSVNVGLKLARGKYIVINDADDFSLPKRIETQLDFIQKHPEYAVVGCSAYIMDKDGTINRVFRKPTDPRKIRLWILTDTPMIHGAVIMNREILLAEGGYDETHVTSQDFEFWSRLMRKGYRVTNVPDILVVIRHYAASMSSRAAERQTVENGRILRANINGMTSLNITDEEAIRHRTFFIAPERLSEDEFRKAEELLISAYRNLNKGIEPDAGFIEADLHEKLVKPYTKFALSRLGEGQSGEARRLAKRYLDVYGPNRLLQVIRLLSFAGRSSVDAALGLHERLQHLAAAISRLRGNH